MHAGFRGLVLHEASALVTTQSRVRTNMSYEGLVLPWTRGAKLRARAVRAAWLAVLVCELAGYGCAGWGPEDDARDARGADVEGATQAITQHATWTGPMSEEFGGPLSCPAGQVVVGVQCNGSFCDQISLRCDNFGASLNPSGNPHWTEWVETGGDIFGNNTLRDAVCAPGEWMTGLDCRGDWCDDVRVACRPSNSRAVDCTWTGLYSEEQPPYYAPDSRFLAGVHCEGTHCDNKRYYVCAARPAPEYSCQNRCGTSATSAACWCDEACTRYGDCCADKGDYCG